MENLGVPFFRGFDKARFAMLGEVCKMRQYPANTTIFRQGDFGDAFYILVSGSVDITINKDGVETKLNTIQAGGYFVSIFIIERLLPC